MEICTLDTLEIVNYAHPNCEPLRSIMQLPREEAFALASRLHAQNPCYAHRRFGSDFPEYYAYRMETEAWLLERFLALGGKPQIEHPYYFALQSCDRLKANFHAGKETRLRLADIDPLAISFTFGDSVAQFSADTRRDPFLLDTLITHIMRYGGVDALLDGIRETYVCIEAQLWVDIVP